MGEVQIIQQRKVSARGAFPTSPEMSRIRPFFFAEEWQLLQQLTISFPLSPFFSVPIPSVPIPPPPVLFYPGCGIDLFRPVLYLEKCFPQIKKAYFIFADIDPVIQLLKVVLDEGGISFAEKEETTLIFFWKQMEITMAVQQADVFTMALPEMDIYFERAFRIMKEEHPDFEKKVLEKVNHGGIILSDSGFQDAFLQRISLPPGLSSYGEMVVGRKKDQLLSINRRDI